MAINYTLGGGKDGPKKPKTFKAPGAIKRLFVNKDKEKFDSGEKNEYLDKKKKTYSVKTGKTITEPLKSETKTIKYEISPAQKGTRTYTPGRAFTNANYPQSSSTSNQEANAGKPKTAYGKQVEQGYQDAVKAEKDTYTVKDPKTGKDNVFKAGTTTVTPDKPAVYGQRTQKLTATIETPEVKELKYGKGIVLKPKKVSNVKDMFKSGYSQGKRKNLLNSQKVR
jgi:hypothetical protein